MIDHNQDKRWIVYALLRDDPYRSLHVGDDDLLWPATGQARRFRSADEAMDYIKSQEPSHKIKAWGMILDWRAPQFNAS